MKFPSYTREPADRLADYRPQFRQLAGSADNESTFTLSCYLADALAKNAEAATSSKNRRQIVSLAGGQGTGKSTMTRLLCRMLEDCFGLSTATLSLDDFYKTRAERTQLGLEVHPLLAVRGVPGTHDIALLESALVGLRAGKSVNVPVFDKGEDDRRDQTRQVTPASVILCEGWCWGAIPEPEDRLVEAMNRLEKTEDPAGVWRRYVNEQLTRYQPAFQADAQVFFKAPSIEAIVRWRYQQEQELESRGGGSKVMTHAEVERFVTFYERVTRWMIREMPSRADVTVEFDDDHRMATVMVR